MGCDYPVKECLADHYALNLGPAKTAANGLQVRARCPACNADRALVISAGEVQKVTWHCHHRCDGTDVRRALIKAGVPIGCVPQGDGTERNIRGEAIDAICSAKGDRAATILRVLAILRGYVRWPSGGELVRLADDAGVSRRSAYRARDAGALTSPRNTSTYTANADANGQPQVSPASRAVRRVPGRHAVPAWHTANVPPMAQTTANANTRGPHGLPQSKRDAILRRHRSGESQHAIAEAEHVSASTVNKYVRRPP